MYISVPDREVPPRIEGRVAGVSSMDPDARLSADRLRAVVFDFGGTLDGPGLTWTERFERLYAAGGIALPDERLRAACGFGTREAYRDPGVARLDLESLVAFHVDRQFRYLSLDDATAAARIVDAFAGDARRALAASRGVLERLSRRFRLGVVSNFYGNLERILIGAGIGGLLGAAIDSTVVGVSKPAPEIFRFATGALDVAAEQCLMVGDSLANDIAPARALGLRTAWLVPTGASAPTADVSVGSLDELERLLSA